MGGEETLLTGIRKYAKSPARQGGLQQREFARSVTLFRRKPAKNSRAAGLGHLYLMTVYHRAVPGTHAQEHASAWPRAFQVKAQSYQAADSIRHVVDNHVCMDPGT